MTDDTSLGRIEIDAFDHRDTSLRAHQLDWRVLARRLDDTAHFASIRLDVNRLHASPIDDGWRNALRA